MTKFVICLWLLLASAPLMAQLNLIPLAPAGSIFQPEACWQVQLDNLGGQTLQLYMEAIVYDQHEQVAWKATSEGFILTPEGRRFEAGSLPIASQHYMQGDQRLPAGSFTLCILVYSQDFQRELTRRCLPVVVSRKGLGAVPLPSLKRPFSFTGEARISGQYADVPQVYSGTEAKFLRLEALPQISAFGIPLKGRLFLTTEDKALRYDANTFNFSFDARQFQQNVRQILQDKLQQQAGGELDKRLQLIRDSVYQQAKQKLSPHLHFLKDSSMMNKLAELRDLERIKELLNMPAYTSFQKKWEKYAHYAPQDLDRIEDSLLHTDSRVYLKFQQLRALQQTYQQVLKRKAQLETQAKQLKKVLQAREKLEQLDRLKQGNLQELAKNPQFYKKLGFLSKTQALFTSIRKLGIGNIFPYYSPLSLQGISLRGGELAVQPGKVYLSLATGKVVQTAFAFDSVQTEGPAQWLAALRAGLGDASKTHLHVVSISSQQRGLGEVFQLKPDNQVIGLEGRAILWQGKFMLDAEWMQSHTRIRPQLLLNRDIVAWDSLFQADDAVQGEAWRIRMQGQLSSQTQIQARYEKIDPTYYSAGAPLLIRDRLRYHLQIKQGFWKRQLEISAFTRRDLNALWALPQTALISKSSGVTMNLRIAKYPYLSLTYSPYSQQTQQIDSLDVERNTGMLNLNSGYAYSIGKLNLNSSLMYLQQAGTASDSIGQYQLSQLQFSQSFSMGLHSLLLRGTYGSQIIAEEKQPILGMEGSISSNFWKKLSLSAGGNYFSRNQQQQSSIFFQFNTQLSHAISIDTFIQHYFKTDLENDFFTPRHPLYQLNISYRW